MRTAGTVLLLPCMAFTLVSCAAVPSNEAAPAARRVAFACANDEEIEVRFFTEQGLAVLNRGGRAVELQQQPSGSGFIYSNGPNTIRGKGDDLTVEVGRMAPLQCKAR